MRETLKTMFTSPALTLLTLLMTTVNALAQHSDRTPNNPASTPYPGSEHNGFDLGFFILVTIGVVVVLVIIGLFVGFRNPFKRKT